MRKIWKKGLSALLAAALVFSTPLAAGPLASAEGTEPQPVETILKGSSVDLSNAIATPLDTYENPLAGKTLEGATISFEYEPTEGAAVRELGAIIALQNVNQDTANIDGRMYITPSSYLGYNADGGHFDANMAVNADGTAKYASDKKCFKASGKQVVTMTFDANGFAVYVDGVLAYDQATMTHPAGDDLTDYSNVLTFLGKANKVLLGLGSFWGAETYDEVNGKVGNIEFYDKALTASQVYALATGSNVKADPLFSNTTVKISEDGKNLEISFTEKVAPDSYTLKINDTAVNAEEITVEGTTGSYSKPLTEEGEYVVELTAAKSGYLDTKVTKKISVKKAGDKYVYDEELVSGLKITDGGEVYNVTWNVKGEGVTCKAVVSDGNKTIATLTESGGQIKKADMTSGTKYTVTLTAEKEGYATKTLTGEVTYTAPKTGEAGSQPGTDLTKITTKPVLSYTFDNADGIELAGDAAVKDGVLNLASSTTQNNKSYAKIGSLGSFDFSNGYS